MVASAGGSARQANPNSSANSDGRGWLSNPPSKEETLLQLIFILIIVLRLGFCKGNDFAQGVPGVQLNAALRKCQAKVSEAKRTLDTTKGLFYMRLKMNRTVLG